MSEVPLYPNVCTPAEALAQETAEAAATGVPRS